MSRRSNKDLAATLLDLEAGGSLDVHAVTTGATDMEDAMAWLSILPAIPLQRAVPVRWLIRGRLGAGRREVVTSVDAEGPSFAEPAATCSHRQAEQRWRVDLNDPQGFAYALRWLIQHRRPHEMLFSSTGAATLRFWLGKTTDADRLALAKAMAEVVS